MESRSQVIIFLLMFIMAGAIVGSWVFSLQIHSRVATLESTPATIIQAAPVDNQQLKQVAATQPETATSSTTQQIFYIDETKTIDTSNLVDYDSLDASIAAVNKRINKVEANQTTGTTTKTTPTTIIREPAFQKVTLSLGAASSTSSNWTDTSQEITLNTNDYPSGTRTWLQAGLNIIGGMAEARLKNKTTGNILHASYVSHNTSTTTWKSSPAFYLDAGTNTYVIQLRSSSSELANMVGARIVLDE